MRNIKQNSPVKSPNKTSQSDSSRGRRIKVEPQNLTDHESEAIPECGQGDGFHNKDVKIPNRSKRKEEHREVGARSMQKLHKINT